MRTAQCLHGVVMVTDAHRLAQHGDRILDDSVAGPPACEGCGDQGVRAMQSGHIPHPPPAGRQGLRATLRIASTDRRHRQAVLCELARAVPRRHGAVRGSTLSPAGFACACAHTTCKARAFGDLLAVSLRTTICQFVGAYRQLWTRCNTVLGHLETVFVHPVLLRARTLVHFGAAMPNAASCAHRLALQVPRDRAAHRLPQQRPV